MFFRRVRDYYCRSFTQRHHANALGGAMDIRPTATRNRRFFMYSRRFCTARSALRFGASLQESPFYAHDAFSASASAAAFVQTLG